MASPADEFLGREDLGFLEGREDGDEGRLGMGDWIGVFYGKM